MKILIADKLSELVVNELEKIGAEVLNKPGATTDELINIIKDIEVLVVRSTRVTADVMQAADNLSLIIRAGAGVNTIDLEFASSHGIHVANCPGKNTAAVAELALGLIIAADRRIANATRDLRDGQWRKKEYGKSNGLKNRTLGIIGYGSIGQALAKRAAALEMEIVAWSRSLTPEIAQKQNITYCSTPADVATHSDVVSVHLAANKETHHLIDSDFFNKMRKGTIFVNTSRGEIVDTKALKDAIKSKELHVGLDVYENEPSGGETEFEQTELAKQITCTPHIGASTYQAAEAIAEGVVEIVQSYLKTGQPINTVNVREKSTDKNSLLIRHYNRVGVLAAVLNVLRHEDVNVEEMENTIFEGGDAATCTLVLDSKPSPDMINKIKDDPNIIQAFLQTYKMEG